VGQCWVTQPRRPLLRRLSPLVLHHPATFRADHKPGQRVRDLRHFVFWALFMGGEHLLHVIEQSSINDGLVQAVYQDRIATPGATADPLAVSNGILRYALIPPDFADVYGILEHPADIGGLKPVAEVGAQTHPVQPVGDDRRAHVLPVHAVCVPVEHGPDDLGLLGNDLQTPPLAALELDALITIDRAGAAVAAVQGGGEAAPLHALFDHGVFPAGEKELDLKKFGVGIVGGIIGLVGRDDQDAGIQKGLHNDALVDAVPAAEAIHVHHQHAVPQAGAHVLQQLPDLGALGDGVPGDDLPIPPRDMDAEAFSQIGQLLFMPGEGFTLAEGFHLNITARFSEIGAVKAVWFDAAHDASLFFWALCAKIV